MYVGVDHDMYNMDNHEASPRDSPVVKIGI